MSWEGGDGGREGGEGGREGGREGSCIIIPFLLNCYFDNTNVVIFLISVSSGLK